MSCTPRKEIGEVVSTVPVCPAPLPPHWPEWFLYTKRALRWLCLVSSIERALEGKGWPRSPGEAVCSELGPLLVVQQLGKGVLGEAWPRAEAVTLEQEVRKNSLAGTWRLGLGPGLPPPLSLLPSWIPCWGPPSTWKLHEVSTVPSLSSMDLLMGLQEARSMIRLCEL